MGLITGFYYLWQQEQILLQDVYSEMVEDAVINVIEEALADVEHSVSSEAVVSGPMDDSFKTANGTKDGVLSNLVSPRREEIDFVLSDKSADPVGRSQLISPVRVLNADQHEILEEYPSCLEQSAIVEASEPNAREDVDEDAKLLGLNSRAGSPSTIR